ncbi:oxidoreductase [Paenibacillus sambharensis]|uniref:Oxidoreductase n=1 Tax=Paenibacillus sambharensis TaxID=1803190 RepID=A0A2W1LNE9_9BACL|nr:NAD(P)H-binding protein [Paenibacillus sambharensis]PZD96415.1 oxidoreductase [Paenibacillus sambharensis]
MRVALHAVVAGASGLVGHELVKLLLDNKQYEQVTVLVRRRLNLTHPKLVQRETDFDRLEQLDGQRELLAGAVVYCTLGTTIKKAGSQEAFAKVDYEYPLALGRLAHQHGAANFLIVTAMGANPKSKVFYNRVKGKVERDLKALGLPSLYIFRPSLLLGKRSEFRLGERIGAAIAAGLPFLWIGGLKKFKPIEAGVVALAMQQAADQGPGGEQVYESSAISQLASK